MTRDENAEPKGRRKWPWTLGVAVAALLAWSMT